MESLHHLHMANPWPVVVCAVMQWLIGAIWYSPVLFAPAWMAALGITPQPGMKKGLIGGMLSSLIGDLVLCFVLWHFIMWAEATTWATGAFIGFLVWLGFFAAPNFAQGIYEKRPFKLFAINNGYWFVCLLITGVVLAVWR